MESFCPEQYKPYVLKKLKLNKNIKAYNKEIPEFLHGRPHAFIKHCMERVYSSAVFTAKDIEDLGKLSFKVKSESTKQIYLVDLSIPTCSCPDWRKFKCPTDLHSELQSLISKLSATVPKSSEGIYIWVSLKKAKRENNKQYFKKLRNIACISKKEKTREKNEQNGSIETA